MSEDPDSAYLSAWHRFDGTQASDQHGNPTVTCLHVSDLHGQLEAGHHVYYDTGESHPGFDFDGERVRIERGGGVPLLTAKLERIREDVAGVVTLMSGDTFHGSAETTYTNGRAMLAPVNEHVRPDVYVPGNWDFSNEAAEEGNARKLFDGLEARVLAANLYEWDTDELVVEPSTIERVNGVAVGIVGMTNAYVDRMAPAFAAGKYRFGKHPALLESAANDVREEGADVVVAVTEIGLPWMVQAAKDVANVDVMFSAHTHEYTHDPIVVEETETVVVESGTADGLGRVDLRLEDDDLSFRHVLYCLSEGHEYTPEPAPEALRTVEAIRSPFRGDDVSHERGAGTLERSLDTVVGETETPLHRQSFLQSGWNLLFTDAVRAHFDTDLGVSHGFRYGPATPEGEITLEHVYQAFPMSAPIARGDAYGQQLLTHFEHFLTDNFTPYVYDQEDGRVRNVSSNAEVVIDPTAKRSRRLVDLLIDGTSVDPEAQYSVATFSRPGDPERDLGNCGFPFRNVRVEDGVVPADVVAAYLEANSPVDYGDTQIVRTADDGGRVQDTPVEGPYPYVQPGVDYGSGDAYCETRFIPTTNRFPEGGQNRFR